MSVNPPRVLRGAGGLLVSLAVILAVWQGFLWAFQVSPFVGKGPVAVWSYLVSGPGAGSHLATLGRQSVVTLRDAMLGLVAGTVAAAVSAVAFNLWRPLEQTLMPVAIVLRAVPLVAMTPLIVLMFGRDLAAVAVIAGIVTFFPALVNITLALRSAPREPLDVCRAYGAGRVATMWKVQVPVALPALFASLRIASPLALVGALLAEWLATGTGLGYQILEAAAVSDYTGLWATVAVTTAYSLALYAVIGAVEARVLRRLGFGPRESDP